jgi:polar amino acid transport system substrate-binding protein
MRFHKALIGIAAAFVLAVATPAIAQNVLTDVMTNKVIRIGIPTDFPPYGSVGTDMEPQGLDIDMANYIGAVLGVKVKLIPVTSVNRIPYLQTKKVDLVISTLGKSSDREKVIDFSSAYSPFYQAVFGLKELEIRGPMDLTGKTIAVTRGATEDMELTKIAPHDTQIRRFEDNSATLSAFVSGQVQLIATGASVASYMITRNPQLSVEYKFVIKESPNFIGVAKGEDALRTKLNEVIAEAKKAGDLDRLSEKWLGRPAGDLPK